MANYQLWKTLRAAHAGSGIALMADVKCRSPRVGQLIAVDEVEHYVAAILDGGADALSVVTEKEYFGGSLDMARRIRTFVDNRSGQGSRRHRRPVPLMRKEFFKRVDQMDESAEFGFDAVHLTLRTIGDLDLAARMKERAEELDMEAVIGVHDKADVLQAVELDAMFIGLNNRDILTFEMDDGTVRHTEEIISLLPPDVLVISESGLMSREDVARAAGAGAHAVLIGTAIAKSPYPAAMVRSLRGCPPLGRAAIALTDSESPERAVELS